MNPLIIYSTVKCTVFKKSTSHSLNELPQVSNISRTNPFVIGKKCQQIKKLWRNSILFHYFPSVFILLFIFGIVKYQFSMILVHNWNCFRKYGIFKYWTLDYHCIYCTCRTNLERNFIDAIPLCNLQVIIVLLWLWRNGAPYSSMVILRYKIQHGKPSLVLIPEIVDHVYDCFGWSTNLDQKKCWNTEDTHEQVGYVEIVGQVLTRNYIDWTRQS